MAQMNEKYDPFGSGFGEIIAQPSGSYRNFLGNLTAVGTAASGIGTAAGGLAGLVRLMKGKSDEEKKAEQQRMQYMEWQNKLAKQQYMTRQRQADWLTGVRNKLKYG